MLVKLENIGRYFPEVDLFAGVNLQLNDGDRVGLVGPNGSGKSQLLAIIAGEVVPDEGRVERRSRLSIGRLAQEVRVDAGRSVRDEAMEVFRPLLELEAEIHRLEEALTHAGPDHLAELMARYGAAKEAYERGDGYSFRARTVAVLHGLGFGDADLDMPCARLSGGQLNRLGLARLLLQKPELMLLDEPTNHLDLPAIRWLEAYLQGWDRSFIVVSHDRYFLDRVVNQVWEIANRRIASWPGNYTRYQRDRHKLLEQQRREYQRQQEFIDKTEDFIRRNIYGQKTRQAQSRRKMLQKLDVIERPSADTRRIHLDLSGVSRSSETVLVLDHLAVGYDRPLVRLPFEMTVLAGERIGIIGENGTGKTTFFRTILGRLAPAGGSFSWGRNISVGYFDQKMESLAGSPIQEIRLLDPLAAEGDLRTFLARFGFHDDDVFKPLEVLSGGEKNRLLLARLIYGRHNVLVLDEPTNHLDIPAREQLEEALEDYPGTLVVITHDRYFLDRIIQKIIRIGAGTAELFHGNYSELEAWGARRAAAAAADAPERPAARPREPEEKPRPAGLSKNERARMERQLADLERRIASAEGRRADIEGILTEPPAGMGGAELARLGHEFEAMGEEIEALIREWEGVAEKLA
jgi:ATP-binding cassette subfamily F protein 3